MSSSTASLRSSLALLAFFAASLSFGAAPAEAAHGASTVTEMLKGLDLPYGTTRTRVLTVLQTRFEREVRRRILRSSDPVEKAELQQKRDQFTSLMSKAWTSTEKGKGPLGISAIGNLVALGPGAGVLRDPSMGHGRWLLFHRDRLYGVVLRLHVDRPMPDWVGALSAVYGRPSSFLHRAGKGGPVVAVEWKVDKATVVLRDHKVQYGTYTLARLDNALWKDARAAVVRADGEKGPSDRSKSEDILQEFLE